MGSPGPSLSTPRAPSCPSRRSHVPAQLHLPVLGAVLAAAQHHRHHARVLLFGLLRLVGPGAPRPGETAALYFVEEGPRRPETPQPPEPPHLTNRPNRRGCAARTPAADFARRGQVFLWVPLASVGGAFVVTAVLSWCMLKFAKCSVLLTFCAAFDMLVRPPTPAASALRCASILPGTSAGPAPSRSRQGGGCDRRWRC